MKKITSILIILTLLLSGITTANADHPHEFWAIDNKYLPAYNSRDYAGIIKYGTEEIEFYKQYPDTDSKRSVMVSRLQAVADAYRELGDYANSAKAYQNLYDYTYPLGTKYRDYYKGAKERVTQYTPVMEMYTDNGQSPYYGAKNEKGNGVLFGLCFDGDTRNQLDNESMVIVYQELDDRLLPINESTVKKASAKGIAVEFALNCRNEASDINRIRSYESHLKEISDTLAKYSNIPVYLRFAAEFDVWTNLAEPSAYKEAFRYVSNYFKSHNSNIAIVWSPNQASNWDIERDDFYPGDEYVDWVGVSSYANKYFKNGSDEEKELFFKNGKNSEPVVALKDLIETYGDRKPIMISESGCGHGTTTNGVNIKENLTDFALHRLKEYYSYLPMVYPQIKLIAYFDQYVNGSEEKYDYRLSTNATLQKEFLKLTKGERFIQDSYSGESTLCYRKVENGQRFNPTFLLSCYARKYDNDTKQVTYFIDDKYVGMSDEIPFSTYIDASAYSGQHTLKAVAAFADGSHMTKEANVNFSDNNKNITVKIDGSRVSFDQNPIIYNDRTMVPMRKIFEELDADVDWDGDTKTVTGKRGDRTVKVAVGSTKMYVNHKLIMLDTPPLILGGRTLVPARAVAEGLGCDVDWEASSSTVYIVPKVFKWSEWLSSLPGGVDSDMYYIESKDEYRTRSRTRDQEYYTTDTRTVLGNYVRTDVSYGRWSDWQDSYISESSTREVETRTQSTPVEYKYYHYCTGYNDDESLRYKTSSRRFTDIATYHELGTLSYRLPEADDGNGGQVLYNEDGSKYRCSNSCYRWYEEQIGGSYTQYRSRPINYEYVYWRWSDWSNWSSWSDWQDGTYSLYYSSSNDDTQIDYENRTLYRYKEK